MYIVKYDRDIFAVDMVQFRDLISRTRGPPTLLQGYGSTIGEFDKFMDYNGDMSDYFTKKQWTKYIGQINWINYITGNHVNSLLKSMNNLSIYFNNNRNIKSVTIIYPYDTKSANIEIVRSTEISHISHIILETSVDDKVLFHIYGVDVELRNNPNILDVPKIQIITKITDIVKFEMIFEVDNMYQYRKLKEYIVGRFGISLKYEIYTEAIGLDPNLLVIKLFTSLIDNDFVESQKYLDTHKHDISTSINYINYTIRIKELHPIIHQRINDFLDWYDETGKKKFDIEKFIYKLDEDSKKHYSIEPTRRVNYRIYEFDGNSMNTYLTSDPTKLIEQLYYTLALIVMEKTDEQGNPEILNEE